MKAGILQSGFILLLILLVGRNSVAQKSEGENLRVQISKETNDTSKVKLLIRFVLYYADSGSARDACLKEAEALSRKNNYRYGFALCQYGEGLLAGRAGRYDEAIAKSKRFIDVLDSMHVVQHLDGFPLFDIRKLFNESGRQTERFRFYTEKAAYYKTHGPVENLAACYHGIAGYYYYLGDYDKAIEYYLRARDAYKSFDPFGSANETEVVGKMYLEWGNLDKAEVYLNSALKELSELRENQDYFYRYHNLGDLYFKRQDYKRAMQYYKEGKKTSEEDPASLLSAMSHVSIAAVYLQLDARDSARLFLDSAEKIRQKEKLGITYPQGNLEIDFNYYLYYLATGNQKHALKCLKAALQEARKSKVIPMALKYTNELHRYLLKTGDSLQALRYLIQNHAIQDTLNRMSTQARIATFEIDQQTQEKEHEIEQLQAQKTTQRNYYLLGGVFFLLILTAIFSRLRYKRKRDKEQLTTEFKKQLAQAETKALRAQMNPHFIFNSLNSINSFVMDQKHEIASDYLIKFSKLIRLILDNSRCEAISLEKELETLRLYVLLESARFDNKFRCVYHIAEEVNPDLVTIPPMLLQPFVENAIWHGLMQKETNGTITVEIKKEDEEFLNISITDDGIGREKAAELKSKSATHNSHGLKVTSQRIEMMNKLNSTGAKVHVIDLKDENGNATGTKVELIIPF